MGSKKTKLIKTDSGMVITRGWRIKKIGKMLFRGTKFQLVDLVSPGDLICSIVSISQQYYKLQSS